MSLRHAILTALLDGDASGYALSKHFDQSVGNFWHALPAQLYPALSRLADEGLIDGTDVEQSQRPNKRVYAITRAGRDELRRWVLETSKPMSLKDELVLRVRSGADTDPAAIVAALAERRIASESKLSGYRQQRDAMLRGRSEDEFLRTASRIGPYLTLLGGIAFEEAHLRWIATAVRTITIRYRLEDHADSA